MTLGLAFKPGRFTLQFANTVVPVPMCEDLGVYTLRICFQFATIAQNLNNELVPENFICARHLNMQYLEIFISGTNCFTLYMCIYIVDIK